jgi:hypothetical protein
MAFAASKDTRTHVMGDMLMVTGTFTDGGTEVSYADLLSTVFAAGAHLTSITDTGIKVNGGNTTATSTVLTVDTKDARNLLRAGQTVYNSAGMKLGVIASVDSGTQITLAAPGLSVDHDNNENYFVLGASQQSLTADAAVDLTNVSANASIDEQNKLVIFEMGAASSALATSVGDGRWWILGQR